MAASTDMTPDMAFLLAVWLETLCYGLLTVMFIQSIIVLVKRKPRPENRGPLFMLFATILMFIIATIHVVVNLYRLIQAFIFHRESDAHPDGPAGYLGLPKDTTNLIQVVMFGIQSLIGDMLNVYRCFVVWDKNWRVTSIPLLLLTLSSATAILVINQYVNVSAEATLFDHQSTLPILLFYATAPTQNIVTTTLIAYRIWAVDKRTRNAHGKNFSLMPALLILVESAAFYSIAEVLLLILYLLGMNAQFLMLETLTPIVGIVFTSIIIRVGLRADSRHPSSAHSKISLDPVGTRISFAPVGRSNSVGKQSQISIRVSQTTVLDHDVEQYVAEDKQSDAHGHDEDGDVESYFNKSRRSLTNRSNTPPV